MSFLPGWNGGILLGGFGAGVGSGSGGGGSAFHALVYKDSGGDQTQGLGVMAAMEWQLDESDDGAIHSEVTNITRFTIPAGWNGRYGRMISNILSDDACVVQHARGGAGFIGAGYNDTAAGVLDTMINTKSAPFPLTSGEYYEVLCGTANVVSNDSGRRTWACFELLASSFRGALARGTGTTLAAGTQTWIDFDLDEAYDTDSIHSLVTNPSRFTVPASVTKVRLWHFFQGGSVSGRFLSGQTKGAGRSSFRGLGAYQNDTAVSDIHSAVSAIVTVSAGEFFEFWALHETATSTSSGDEAAAMEILPDAVRYALVYRSTNQSVSANTNTNVNWDAEDADTDGIHSTVTNTSRLTVPSGVTHVRLSAQLVTNSLPGTLQLKILKNGSEIYVGCAHHRNTVASGSCGANLMSPILEVVPGDYFELQVQHTQAFTITGGSNSNWFQMEIIEDQSA